MKAPVFDPAWPADVQALYRHDVQEIWDRSLAPCIWNQYHNQLDYYIRLAGNDAQDVLDVGCAQGTLALLLAERGHRVTAVDLRPAFLEYAKSRHTSGEVRFIAGNVLADEIPGTYDLVYANQIIEHLVYPEQLLAKLSTLMKPGARLVVTTPNASYVKNRLPTFTELGDVKQWEHLQFTADGDGHFFAYSCEELISIFRSAGFSNVCATFFESPIISGHMKLRYVHPYVPTPILRTLDRLLVGIPWLGLRFTHQLMVTGVWTGTP